VTDKCLVHHKESQLTDRMSNPPEERRDRGGRQDRWQTARHKVRRALLKTLEDARAHTSACSLVSPTYALALSPSSPRPRPRLSRCTERLFVISYSRSALDICPSLGPGTSTNAQIDQTLAYVLQHSPGTSNLGWVLDLAHSTSSQRVRTLPRQP
jgi:hypothetical protein